MNTNFIQPRKEAEDIPVMFARYDSKGIWMKTGIPVNDARWKRIDQDGSVLDLIVGNTRHPLDNVDQLPVIEAAESISTICFDFSLAPSSFTVQYWPEVYAGFREAYEVMYETMKVIGDSINIPHWENGNILRVHAMWPQGYANYAFYLIPDMRFSQASK